MFKPGIPKARRKRKGRGLTRGFWNFRKQGGANVLMLPVVGYGYFLESRNHPVVYSEGAKCGF